MAYFNFFGKCSSKTCVALQFPHKSRLKQMTCFNIYRLVAPCLKHGNKPFGSIKGTEFHDYLIEYYILKKDYTSELFIWPVTGVTSSAGTYSRTSEKYICCNSISTTNLTHFREVSVNSTVV